MLGSVDDSSLCLTPSLPGEYVWHHNETALQVPPSCFPAVMNVVLLMAEEKMYWHTPSGGGNGQARGVKEARPYTSLGPNTKTAGLCLPYYTPMRKKED